jgi:hypothetical protein
MKKGVWLIIFLFCFCFLTMATGILSTHRQVRQIFKIPNHMGVIPGNVRSVILDQLSLNSSLEQVNIFLASRGAGRDGRSRCLPENANSQIVCSVGLQHWFWEGIRETYFISFEFDAHQRLCNVSVHAKITGPNTKA